MSTSYSWHSVVTEAQGLGFTRLYGGLWVSGASHRNPKAFKAVQKLLWQKKLAFAEVRTLVKFQNTSPHTSPSCPQRHGDVLMLGSSWEHESCIPGEFAWRSAKLLKRAFAKIGLLAPGILAPVGVSSNPFVWHKGLPKTLL